MPFPCNTFLTSKWIENVKQLKKDGSLPVSAKSDKFALKNLRKYLPIEDTYK
jgi:spore maturation protein CgeB